MKPQRLFVHASRPCLTRGQEPGYILPSLRLDKNGHMLAAWDACSSLGGQVYRGVGTEPGVLLARIDAEASREGVQGLQPPKQVLAPFSSPAPAPDKGGDGAGSPPTWPSHFGTNQTILVVGAPQHRLPPAI